MMNMRKTGLKWQGVIVILLLALITIPLWVSGWLFGIAFGVVSDGFNIGYGRQIVRRRDVLRVFTTSTQEPQPPQ